MKEYESKIDDHKMSVHVVTVSYVLSMTSILSLPSRYFLLKGRKEDVVKHTDPLQYASAPLSSPCVKLSLPAAGSTFAFKHLTDLKEK